MSQLTSALETAIESGDSTSADLYKSLVTLSSQASSSTSTDSTYGINGLLDSVNSALMLNDPLLATDESDSGSYFSSLASSSTTTTSSLSALYQSIQDSSE